MLKNYIFCRKYGNYDQYNTSHCGNLNVTITDDNQKRLLCKKPIYCAKQPIARINVQSPLFQVCL